MSGKRVTPILTEDEAIARAKSIQTNLNYRIFINLLKGEVFSGLVQIDFRLHNKDTVFLDYCGDEVNHIALNNHDLDAEASYDAQKGRITLDPAHLKGNGLLNQVRIQFKNRYYTDGNGLHTYTDEDGLQYLYTQSEPYWGNRVFPMFDQPDLKARYSLNAASPQDWIVLTSVAERNCCTWQQFVADDFGSRYYKEIRRLFGEEVPAEHKWWRFEPTELLSTYLQNIVCGPYEVIHLDKAKRYRGLPMAIYARKALITYAEEQAHNIFEYNKRGIEYYERYFGLEYQFSKLDTIFCPEYTVGAMEYPGAVTYTERFIPKNKNTVALVSSRGSTILHELAHMWFGDAVTMRWWNGLWLNESFADFVCYLAWAWARPKFDFETEDPWVAFMTRKGWGYKEDQEHTTHKIATSCKNTQIADNIFDGITYSKGAATMRQLVALVGEEKFSLGLEEYFNEFCFRNTELEDLLDIFQKHLGDRINEHRAYDINNWKESWLKKAGLNTVEAVWEVGAENLKLIQGVSLKEFPTLRFHRINIGLFDKDGKLIKKLETILEDQKETTVAVEGGIPAETVAVLPNYDDLSFIKVILDENSLAFFGDSLHLIEQPLAKTLVLRALYDAVRDARTKASDLITIVSKFLTDEPSNQIFNVIFRYISPCINILPSNQHKESLHKLFKVVYEKLIVTDDPQFQLSLISKLISYASHPDDIHHLKLWHEGTHEKLKYDLAIKNRWSIVYRICGSEKYTAEEKKAAFDKLFAEDATDTKTNYKFLITALQADEEKRKELLEQEYFNADTKLSYYQLSFSMAGYTSKFVDKEVRESYHDFFWTNILGVDKERSQQVTSVSYSWTSFKNRIKLINCLGFSNFFNFLLIFRLFGEDCSQTQMTLRVSSSTWRSSRLSSTRKRTGTPST